MNDLLQSALAAKPSERINWPRIMPAVKVLREKGWTFTDIYQWLKAKGEAVHKTKTSFVACASARIKQEGGK